MLQNAQSNFIFSTIEMKEPFKYRWFVVHVSLDAWANSMFGYARGLFLRLGIRVTLVQTFKSPNQSSNLAYKIDYYYGCIHSCLCVSMSLYYSGISNYCLSSLPLIDSHYKEHWKGGQE